MEVHILDFFVIDFPILEYDIPLSYYRKNIRDISDKSSESEKDKLLTAAEAVRKLTYENYFQKNDNSDGKTLSDVLSDCQSRFRPNFKKSEFSSALRYAIKTNRLKRYKKNGSGPYIYYTED